MIFFEQLLILLTSALVVSVLLLRLRMPTLVAYIGVGALVGPYALNWVSDPREFSFLAEFGVVFLLFALGLEFSTDKLWALRKTVFGIGGVQVSACCALFGVAVYLWGRDFENAVIIAGALALSSTAIVTKELTHLKQTHTRAGHLSIGVLLFQDLAAILFLILIPVLSGESNTALYQSILIALCKGCLLFLLLMSIGKWILPIIYKEIARSHSDEIFVLTTLVICLVSAWLTHYFHLSMALGSFVVGMMLGESQFKDQIEKDISSFKHVLLSLFFITIGMNIDLTLLPDYWLRLIVFTIGLTIIKAIAVIGVIMALREKPKDAIQSGLYLAQAGEFGIALITLAKIHSILPSDQASFIILIAVFSMMLSPWIIRYSEQTIRTWNYEKG